MIEITPWSIYLITRMDNIQGMFIVAAVLAGLGTIISLMVWLIEDEEKAESYFLTFLVAALLSTVFGVLTPNTKEVASMVIIPRVLANEEVKKLPDNFLKLANEWMEELRPKGEQK